MTIRGLVVAGTNQFFVRNRGHRKTRRDHGIDTGPKQKLRMLGLPQSVPPRQPSAALGCHCQRTVAGTASDGRQQRAPASISATGHSPAGTGSALHDRFSLQFFVKERIGPTQKRFI